MRASEMGSASEQVSEDEADVADERPEGEDEGEGPEPHLYKFSELLQFKMEQEDLEFDDLDDSEEEEYDSEEEEDDAEGGGGRMSLRSPVGITATRRSR